MRSLFGSITLAVLPFCIFLAPAAKAAPSITSLSPTSGAVGASVTITGANFGATKGTSTVKFNGTTATPTAWSATSIVIPIPAGATTGNVVVTVSSVASNGKSFTVVSAPSITSLAPTSGVVGISVTITGTNFGATQGSSTVKFNGTTATPTSWTATSIAVPVPTGATTGNVIVHASGVDSNGKSFTVALPPGMNSLSPTSGAVGASITINGSNFGGTQGSSTVKFNGTTATTITSWSATSIVAKVPTGAISGNVVVHASGVDSNGASFTVVPAPSISSLSPTSGAVSATTNVLGSNFGSTQGSGTVKFNGTLATTITNWSATSITVSVPVGATTGNVVVNASGVASNGKSFTVLPTPSVTGLSQNSGTANAQVTITGTGFGSTQGSGYVSFGGVSAGIFSWNATSIVAQMSGSTSPGTVQVTVNAAGVSSNSLPFTALPSTTSLSPSTGPIGGSVVIAGANFGTAGTVTFNGITASTTSWTPTSLTATVPNLATTGNVVVTSNATSSAGVNFTVAPNSNVSGISVNSGGAGTSVIISGSNFGSTQGAENGTVIFNGATAQITNWSATSITAQVPSNAAPGLGSVSVSLSGALSNSFPFTVVPSLTSLSASSGGIGSWLTIFGADLGASQGSGSVLFGSTSATVVGWDSSAVTVQVPNLPAGTVSVTVATGGTTTSAQQFSVAPAATTLSPAAAQVGQTVTIAGSNFGTSGIVSFNGVGATPQNWTDNTIVTQVPPGATSGLVVVSVAGVATDGLPFIVIPSAAQSTGISVVPSNPSMLSGDTRNFSALDSNGNPVVGVVWTSSDAGVAAFDPTGLLTANNAGQATVTATYQGFTAQTNVTVYVGVGLPAGTVIWSAPSISGFSPGQLIPATPTGTNTVDFFSVDVGGSSGTDVTVRGLTADGRHMWTSPVVGNALLPYLPGSFAGVPDHNGGLLLKQILSNGPRAIVRLDGSTGLPTWSTRVSAPASVYDTSTAVHPDGTIYVLSANSALNHQGLTSYIQFQVTALNGATGAPKFTVNLPPSSHTSSYNGFPYAGDQVWASASPISITADGSVYVETISANDSDSTVSTVGANYGTVSLDDELILTKILSDGSFTKQTLKSYVCSSSYQNGYNPTYLACVNGVPDWILGEVIPDGQGGVLASYSHCDFSNCANVSKQFTGGVFHATSGGSAQEFSYQFPPCPVNDATCGTPLFMVLGDNNTAFAADLVHLVAFDVNSGTQRWTKTPGSYLSLVAGIVGGGLVVNEQSGWTNASPQTVVRFDAGGNPTPDTWTSSAATNAGASGLAKISYVAADAFSTNPTDPQGLPLPQTLMVASAAPLDWALFSPWAASPADRSSDPKVKVTLSVSNVYASNPQDIQTDSTVLAKVNNARNFWWKKAKIQLNWDSTIHPVKSCDPVAYPSGCGFNMLLDIAEVTNPTTANEVVRRFCVSGQSPKCTIQGSQLIFNRDEGTAEGYTPFTGPMNAAVFMNIAAISASALEDDDTADSSGHDLSHELGHQFQLHHLGWSLPSNLMCSGMVFCSTHAGGHLTADQIKDAQNGAARYQ